MKRSAHNGLEFLHARANRELNSLILSLLCRKNFSNVVSNIHLKSALIDERMVIRVMKIVRHCALATSIETDIIFSR